MDDKARQLLTAAEQEIRTLRMQLRHANTRLEMFDDMMTLLHTQPAHKSTPMTNDIAWEIARHLAEHPPEEAPTS